MHNIYQNSTLTETNDSSHLEKCNFDIPFFSHRVSHFYMMGFLSLMLHEMSSFSK
jgi:hypothetical protein